MDIKGISQELTNQYINQSVFIARLIFIPSRLPSNLTFHSFYSSFLRTRLKILTEQSRKISPALGWPSEAVSTLSF